MDRHLIVWLMMKIDQVTYNEFSIGMSAIIDLACPVLRHYEIELKLEKRKI